MAIDWGDAPAWGALVLSLGSFGISLWATAESRKSRKATEESAEAAKRSADAGEVSAQAAVRSAQAAEKAHQLAEQQYRDSLPPDVAWEIVPTSKSRYQLVNVGTETATGVTIDPSDLPLGRDLPRDATVPGNGGYVEFFIFRSMQAKAPNEVKVTWDGAPEPAIVPLRKL